MTRPAAPPNWTISTPSAPPAGVFVAAEPPSRPALRLGLRWRSGTYRLHQHNVNVSSHRSPAANLRRDEELGEMDVT